MKIEKDFIIREFQRLTLLLTSLIMKISGLNSNNAKNGIEQTNEALKGEFDLTLQKITQMENSDLLKHIKGLHESHVEKLAELMYELIIKPDIEEYYEKKKLAQKAILLIDFLNEKSKTFSMKRVKIKNALQQRL